MLTRTAPRSDDPYIDSLLWFNIWDGLTITFSFPDSASDYDDYGPGYEIVEGFSSFSQMQMDAARHILSTIASFTNLVFVELTGDDDADATLRFGNTTITDTAFAFLPGNDPAGGDTWVSSAIEMLSPVIGNYAYFTLMHEIGHALGLDHPHEADASSPMPLDREWMANTVMSYRSYENAPLDGYTNNENEFAQTFMTEDIAALQIMYGASYGDAGETKTYAFDPDTGEMTVNGVSQGVPNANVIYSTIWGGSIETYDFSNYDVPTWIDLRPGEWTRTLERQGTSYTAESFRNAYLHEGDERGFIENAIGGSGDDEIRGNDAANRIEGGDGNDGILGYRGDDHLLGGKGTDHLWGGHGDDTLEGDGGDDFLYGESDDDILIGGGGNDGLYGGAGNDTLYGNGGANYLDGGTGHDILFAGDNREEFGISQLFGGDGNDELYGGIGNDKLTGGKGNDLLVGGLGDDIYIFAVGDGTDTVVEEADGGIDSIYADFSLVLAQTIENGRLEGFENLDITGNDADNLLEGNYGDNIIFGGAGADEMRGSQGDDTYYVDNPGDKIVEGVGAGNDTVYTSVSYVIELGYTITYRSGFSQFFAGPEIDNLIMTGTADLNATGNEARTYFQGNSGNNRIAPGEGRDFIDGGSGTDTAVFQFDMSQYQIREETPGVWIINGAEGKNTLTNMELAQFADQTISFVTVPTIEGTDGVDTLNGTADDEHIFGYRANDILNGFAGSDLLDGGQGDDTMAGGLGNDTYYFDSLGDTASELAGEGFDRIISSVKLNTQLLGFENIEAFELQGIANTLIGNNSAQELIANPDILSKLFGLGGADTLIGGIGNDKLYGGADDDILTGGAGRDRMDGGTGADAMTGGVGDDRYFVDDLGDTVTELANEGIDLIKTTVDWTLGANLENLRMGAGATSGIGNALDNAIFAVTPGSILRGMDGHDTLRGSTGDDQLFGNRGNDDMNGRAGNDDLRGGGGNDTIRGRAGEDTILGGSGNDTLNGGKDNDTINGGADQDILIGEGGADAFTFADGDFAGLSAGTADAILDFDQAEGDTIDLSAVDAILGGGDDAFTFIANAAFSNTAGELRFEQDNGNTMIYMDVNGDGLADYAIRLDGTLNLAEADFIL